MRRPVTTESRRRARFACSLVVPFVVQAVLLVTMQTVGPRLPDATGFVVLMLSAGAGFAFLREELRHTTLVITGLLYFPLMTAMLFYFSVAFGLRVFGEGP